MGDGGGIECGAASCHSGNVYEGPGPVPGARTVVVCGSRTWTDRSTLFDQMDRLHADGPIQHVLTGGAPGADRLGEEWAREHGLRLTVLRAEWQLYGRSAGPIRNTKLIEMQPDLVVAFWDGESAGTRHMIRLAIHHKVPVIVVWG